LKLFEYSWRNFKSCDPFAKARPSVAIDNHRQGGRKTPHRQQAFFRLLMMITARRNAAMSEEKPEPGISPSADWREPEHYNPLLNSDRHCWAGEWLRRNPAFLADL